MSTEEIESWNRRYADVEGFLFGERPNAFLERQRPRLRPGMRTLAVADGEGRNGVWLAEQGLSVLSVDGSSVAQERARRLAAARGVRLELEEADLESWRWPEGGFDLVVAIFIQFAGPALRETIFAGMRRALRPGGLLLLEGYRPEQVAYGTGGPRTLSHLYTEPLLRGAFADLEILELAAYDAVIEEGERHRGMSALIDLVARKPA
jgi:SAM-dependent methyltransferase